MNFFVTALLLLPPAAYAAKTPKQISYARIPLSFEANQGQVDPAVRFVSKGSGYTLFLTPSEAVLSLKGAGPETVLRMSLPNSNPTPSLLAADAQPGYSNYFHGRDQSRWLTQVPHYASVRYQEVYPGIDLVYYGNQRQLEYDFVLAPGADPNQIRLRFQGHSRLRIDPSGNLVVKLGTSEVVQHKPLIYQQIGGQRRIVDGRYIVTARNEVRFQVARYNRAQKLVIDPVLSFSTYLGGNGQDDGRGIVLDSLGNIIVTGATTSVNFPTATSLQPKRGDGFDAYVTKINPAGTTILYSTYLGGGGVLNEDGGVSIALDPVNNIYVAGVTVSSEFPVTDKAVQATFGGGIFRDGFVAKLNAEGTRLVYATYLGGSDEDFVEGIAVDADGQAYVTGYTKSPNFPVRNAIQTNLKGGDDAFLTKLNTAGTQIIYSTYIGGIAVDRAYDIVVDATQQVYLCGETASPDFPAISSFQNVKKDGVDAFVLRVNTTGTSISLSTFLGGAGKDQAFALALDSSGAIYVAGETSSNDFPTLSAFQRTFGGFSDAFVTKLNANASALVYSTYLGGSVTDGAYDIAVDSVGQAYITGGTWSENFPLKDPIQATNGGDFRDAFVSVIGATGNLLVFSTYLGGSGLDNWDNVIDFRGYGGIAVDAAKNIFVVGTTASNNFPTTPNVFQRSYGGNTTLGEGDAFVAKITLNTDNGGGGGGGGGTGGNATTITTFPSGLRYTVDGTFYTTSQTFTWAAGETHQISTEPQQGDNSSRYTFASWTNGGAAAQTFTVGSTATLLVANFSAQHYLTMIAGTGGTVSPPSGWFNQGQQIGITASPAPGYTFAGWNGTGTGSTSSTANPALITINAPITQAAFFNSGSVGLVPTTYVPIAPCRIVDTRAGQGTSGAFGPPIMAAGSTRTIPIPTSGCNIPSTVRAYSLNLTVVPSEPLSYLSIYPSGQNRPLVSTLNSFDGRIVANAAIVPAGSNGSVDVYVTNRTEVIIDVTGYFVNMFQGNGMPFNTVVPCRAVDTRAGQGTTGAFGTPIMQGNSSRDFPLPTSRCTLPANAQAYSLNATVVPSVALGYLSLWPQGQTRPTVSTLNAPDGAVTANAAIVPAGNSGGVSAFVTDTSDLILDVNGYFGTGGANPLVFTPVAPCRLADTRQGEGKSGEFGPPTLAAGATRTITVPAGSCQVPATARAYSLNVTVVPQGSLPYLTIWPAGQSQPVVSTLNSFAGKILANAAIVPAGTNGAISVFVAAASDVIVDINGYFAPQPQ